MTRRGRRLLVGTGVVAAAAVIGLGAVWIGRDHGVAAWAAGPPVASPSAPAGETTAARAAASSSRAVALPTRVPEPTPGQVVATDAPQPTTGGSVQVVTTYAAWEAPQGVSSVDGRSGRVLVDGYVAGVIESSGTCTVTLTKDGVTVTGHAAGEADATTTVCGGLAVSDPRLTPGTWSAVLSYRSATSSGAARPVNVTVTPR